MKTRTRCSLALSAVFLAALSSNALAQEFPEEDGGPLPAYALRIQLTNKSAPPILAGNGLPNIVITGYWPPTNEMLRQFSTNPEQNPGGWVGENWEDRGYNIYAFFPEFPGGVGQGEGDFEVDYQDTSADWWRIVPALSPIALMTFSRAGFDHDWEMEGGNRTYAAEDWTPDFTAPTQPTPELPIMMEEPPGTERRSSQPMQRIVDAVNQEVPALDAYIASFDNSMYLSNFIGYHGNWYHDLHEDADDPLWTITGGHVHVGYAMNLADAVHATEVTLRTLIAHVDEERDLPIPTTSEWGVVAMLLLTLTAGTLVFIRTRA